jgi:hypothetical protein
VMGSQNLGPAVGRAVSCLAAAISGGGGLSNIATLLFPP